MTCSSVSCNPKLAAAIFVPVAVVLLLLAAAVAFLFLRRRGRNAQTAERRSGRGVGAGLLGGGLGLGAGLAFFSHGAETNYVTPPRSSAGTMSSRAPSMREVDGSFGPLGAGIGAGAAGLAAARGISQHDFGRGFVGDATSSEDADTTAPPPYEHGGFTDASGAAAQPSDVTQQSSVIPPPVAAHRRDVDPFADPAQNPFGDETADNVSLLSGDTAVNRGNRSTRDNASIVSSLRDMDEAGSVHEAMLGNISRGPSLSGMIGGRLGGSFRDRSPRPRSSS